MKLIFFLLSVLFVLPALAQNKTYFQQEVNYKINVRLNDANHTFSAYEEIEYINNSPDALTFLYFHIWPNAYKDDNTALAKQILESGSSKFYWSKAEDRGFIDSLDFKIDGSRIKWKVLKDSIDIAILYLDKPLNPGARIKITTPFFVKIPSGEISRLGHIGQSYQITQWYPKPAVYDMNGWNQIPYLNQGEFYSEFGAFDVSITLPKNYVLQATGDMYDSDAEIAWLNQKAEETKAKNLSDSTMKKRSRDLSFPKSDAEYKTVKFKQTKVHDFAWFCDKRYNVMKSEVELPHSKRKVTTWALFTNENADIWKKGADYINDAVYYYSLWNGDYPYNHCTAVDGTISAGGGMEYPNITVIGSTENAFALDLVIAHEVGHNWFYGILGSNERVHGWMDEGINSFNELRYVATKYPNEGMTEIIGGDNKLTNFFELNKYKQRHQYELLPQFMMHRNQDQPIETHSAKFSEINYGAIMYSKTAWVFNYLRNYLGDATFDKCMQDYYNNWSFKHPQPGDLRTVFERNTKKDLSWFFDDLINTTKKIDYKIKRRVQKTADIEYILLKNKGEIASPVCVSAFKDDKKVVSMWYDGFKDKLWVNFPPGDYDLIMIDDNREMAEYNRKNDYLFLNKPLKKFEPVRFKFAGRLNDPAKNVISCMPVVGYNAYNGFQAGMLFHNVTVPQHKIDYVIMPMFGFKTEDVNGYANVGYFISTKKCFESIRISATYKRFGYMSFQTYSGNDLYTFSYQKIAPEAMFTFKKKNMHGNVKQTLRLRSVFIQNNLVGYDVDSLFGLSKGFGLYNVAAYNFNNKLAVNPYGFTIEAQNFGGAYRLTAEFNYKISYRKKKKGIDFRIFAGRTFGDARDQNNLALSMSGNNDYLYDNTVMARQYFNSRGTLTGAQTILKDGGFRNYVPFSGSEFITSANITASIPKTPFALYADLGYGINTTYSSIGAVKTLEFNNNGGVAVIIIPKMFEIYFPLFGSATFADKNYFNYVTFQLNFNMANPFEQLRNFER